MAPQSELQHRLTRRRFLELSGTGIGTAALATLFGDDLLAQSPPDAIGGLSGLPHFAPRARRVIYLFQGGAPSQHDLWEHKPQIADLRADRPARLGPLGRRPVRRLVLLDRPLFERQRLLPGQELAVAVPFGPLERRQGPEVPHAVQVGRTPQRPRRFTGLGVADGGRQQQRQYEQSGHGAMRHAHLVLSRKGSSKVRTPPAPLVPGLDDTGVRRTG